MFLSHKDLEDKKLFFVSCANWKCLMPAENAVSAATKAIFQAEEQLGNDMYLDATMQTLDLSELDLNFDIDKKYKMHYTPTILSNAGLHNSAKKLKLIIDLQGKEDEDE